MFSCAPCRASGYTDWKVAEVQGPSWPWAAALTGPGSGLGPGALALAPWVPRLTVSRGPGSPLRLTSLFKFQNATRYIVWKLRFPLDVLTCRAATLCSVQRCNSAWVVGCCCLWRWVLRAFPCSLRYPLPGALTFCSRFPSRLRGGGCRRWRPLRRPQRHLLRKQRRGWVLLLWALLGLPHLSPAGCNAWGAFCGTVMSARELMCTGRRRCSTFQKRHSARKVAPRAACRTSLFRATPPITRCACLMEEDVSRAM